MAVMLYNVVVDVGGLGQEVYSCSSRKDAEAVAHFLIESEFDYIWDDDEIWDDLENDVFSAPAYGVYIVIHECEVVDDVERFKVERRRELALHCDICDVPTSQSEYYMTTRSVWYDEAGMDKGILCVGCLEQKIGRELCAADFTDAPINTEERFNRSARLTDRLSRKGAEVAA